MPGGPKAARGSAFLDLAFSRISAAEGRSSAWSCSVLRAALTNSVWSATQLEGYRNSEAHTEHTQDVSTSAFWLGTSGTQLQVV